MAEKKSTQLPDYVASATPNPFSNRVFWLTSTASTYAGVMLWFVFWQSVPNGDLPNPGGLLVAGLPLAIGALILAAFLCHFCCYVAPGMLGMKSGLPLSIVGTSTYGVQGGFFMPGFLMGALQFGWLSVNAFFSGQLLASIFMSTTLEAATGTPLHLGIAILWILLAVFMGFNGIKYVGLVASFTPIIPIAVLLFWFSQTAGGLGSFNPSQLLAGAEESAKPVSLYGSQALGVLSIMCAYVVGFFATAGAAGCDFGSNNKDAKAVQLGGLVGIVLATAFTGTFALLIIAGAQGSNPEAAVSSMNVTALMEKISPNSAKVCMFFLALAAFPSACFPSLIAANQFKAALPKVKPLYSCGVGVIVAIILVVTGLAGKAGGVFTVVGASFGPICGAMLADYLLSGCKWAGPRAGFNPAGWVSWFFGFIVGAATLVVKDFMGGTMPFEIPCPPMSAFLVGFGLYFILAKAGLESKKLDMPQRIDVE